MVHHKRKEASRRVFFIAPDSIIDQLNIFEEETNQESRSSAIRGLIMKGLEFEQLQRLSSDPDKKLEFDRRLKELTTQKGIENAMKDMKPKELENLIEVAQKMKDKTITQLVIDIQSGK